MKSEVLFHSFKRDAIDFSNTFPKGTTEDEEVKQRKGSTALHEVAFDLIPEPHGLLRTTRRTELGIALNTIEYPPPPQKKTNYEIIKETTEVRAVLSWVSQKETHFMGFSAPMKD